MPVTNPYSLAQMAGTSWSNALELLRDIESEEEEEEETMQVQLEQDQNQQSLDCAQQFAIDVMPDRDMINSVNLSLDEDKQALYMDVEGLGQNIEDSSSWNPSSHGDDSAQQYTLQYMPPHGNDDMHEQEVIFMNADNNLTQQDIDNILGTILNIPNARQNLSDMAEWENVVAPEQLTVDLETVMADHQNAFSATGKHTIQSFLCCLCWCWYTLVVIVRRQWRHRSASYRCIDMNVLCDA